MATPKKGSYIDLLTWIVFAVLLCGEIAPAQDKDAQPSLAETTDWIKTTLTLHGIVATKSTYFVNRTTSTVEFDGCVMSATVVTTTTIDGNSPITLATSEIKFPLGDISSVTVEADESRNSDQSIRLRLNKPGRLRVRPSSANSPLSADQFVIYCDDKQIAERIKKALLHAAALCAKKKEPF